MILKRMIINNFQKHRLLKVEFDRGITTIIGQSDRGKSSVIRALVWALTNKPGGDSFITEGEKECRVKLYFDSGDVLERVKSKKENIYILNDKEFKAIRSDVPEEIADFLKIDENNIQNQHDPVFWFSNSAGEVSRNLNRIANLDIIDHTFHGLSEKKREADAKIDSLHSMIEDAKKKLKFSESIEKFNHIRNKIGGLEKKRENVEENIQKLTRISERIKNGSRKVGILAKADSASEKCLELISDIAKIENRKNGIERICSAVKEAKRSVSRWSNIGEWITDIDSLINVARERNEFIKKITTLNNIVAESKIITNTIRNSETEYRRLDAEFHKNLDGKVCPLCGRIGE